MLPENLKNYKQFIAIYVDTGFDYVWQIEINMTL